MQTGLKDKVVVLAGAAGRKGSIGDAMLQGVVAEGAKPVLLDIHQRGQAYAQELQAAGIDAMFIQTDLTKPVAVENAINKVADHYGRIDVLINNVGVNDGVGLSGTYDEFMSSLKLNLVSYWLSTKYCFPWLKASQGNVLNIGSKVALTGQGNTSAYAAAKGGILSLTREWAIDFLPHKMRANAILIAECWTPSYDSWINSLADGPKKLKQIQRKIPLENRMTTPQEIAHTAVFLISKLSAHTTGQHVFVDGGYTHLDRALLSAK